MSRPGSIAATRHSWTRPKAAECAARSISPDTTASGSLGIQRGHAAAPSGTGHHRFASVRGQRSSSQDALDNFIVGHDLVQEALDREWGKAEIHRLGYENSEDAVTWNVFRWLQEAGELQLAVRILGGFDPPAESDLFLWGRQICRTASKEWPRLAKARNMVEPWGGQQTEPDCCIHVPGRAWLFVEAKFGSPTTTKKTDAARDAWLERYERTCPEVFDRDAVRKTPARMFPEQLLRNVALGLKVRSQHERLIVVALVRDRDATSAPAIASGCLSLTEVRCSTEPGRGSRDAARTLRTRRPTPLLRAEELSASTRLQRLTPGSVSPRCWVGSGHASAETRCPERRNNDLVGRDAKRWFAGSLPHEQVCAPEPEFLVLSLRPGLTVVVGGEAATNASGQPNGTSNPTFSAWLARAKRRGSSTPSSSCSTKTGSSASARTVARGTRLERPGGNRTREPGMPV